MIKLTKGDHEVKFEIVIPTKKGLIFAMYFRWNLEVAGVMTDNTKKVRMMANKVHDKFGHADKTATQARQQKPLAWRLYGET